jgi:tripartite-type tricarboxylate transporter receptor subunit TctC
MAPIAGPPSCISEAWMQSKTAMCRARNNWRAIAWLLMLGALASTVPPASAASDYPSRPIRFVVPTGPGSAQDIVARLLQPYLESLGQPVIIDNRAGAGTIIGTDAVAKAIPDGHTLLIVPTTFTVNAATHAKLPYHVERDFEPVATIASNPLLLTVNAKSSARTVPEFVALAKAAPGKLNYATPGTASHPHLLMELLSAQAGIRLQHIPYRGGGPATLSLISGETHLALLSPLAVQPHIQSGALRPLGSGGVARDPQFPDLPTIAEQGFPGFEATQWLGLLTTGRTPKNVVQRLNIEVNRALRDPNLVAKFLAQGTMTAGGSSEEFRDLIAYEIQRWGELALTSGIK